MVENEGELAVTLTEHDFLAVGVAEEEVPTWEQCALVHGQREQFHKLIDWTGVQKDVWREVYSPDENSRIVVVIHHVPRFLCCKPSELPEEFAALVDLYPAVRTTTLTYESGEVDYIVDRSDGWYFEEWEKSYDVLRNLLVLIEAVPPAFLDA